MLAQSFMTAAELGIEEVERQALIKVLGMLERGEITSKQFNMSRLQSDCGTVGCICGWAYKVSDGKAFREVGGPSWTAVSMLADRLNVPTSNLFAIARDGSDQNNGRIWGRATPASAAMALRSYLTTGDARWDFALSDQQSVALADTSREAV